MTDRISSDDLAILRSLPRVVYSPGRETAERYGKLEQRGLLEATDIGSDEAQETILRIDVTPAGRKALEFNND
ncbi:hypothetical protein [Pelagibacterium lentulum]|uniref:Uncharacterized protein n=1 Tax=Pelagibacterium lentulum TaxID=2029865 RepID=A0A916RCY0_9HYPH|nr:hypothetical protein [Pelagibacterium lentulum]GGA45818.1 hypothetical protein GCM10011499_14440 [Pelagibacterium lentulum]